MDELDFAFWVEERLVFVLAFSVAADDTSTARYIWHWGDGTTSTSDAFTSHYYHIEGERFLVRLARIAPDGATTHSAEAWITFDETDEPLPFAIEESAAAGHESAYSRPKTPNEGSRAASDAEQIVLGSGEPEIVYEAPAAPVPVAVLLLAAIQIWRRRVRG